jgi:hypothetical protein
MAAVDWSMLEPYVMGAYEEHGRIERADVIDLAYGENADDDVIDTIDAIGSRVFNTPEDVRAFLVSQKLVNE